jgi:hypothetical protein
MTPFQLLAALGVETKKAEPVPAAIDEIAIREQFAALRQEQRSLH